MLIYLEAIKDFNKEFGQFGKSGMQQFINKTGELRGQPSSGVVLLFFIGSVVLASALPAYCADDSLASDYLYEYSLKRYGEGKNADAVHEISKTLEADPKDIKTKYVSQKISPRGGLVASTKSNHLMAEDDRVCPQEEVIFNVLEASKYGQKNLFYTWDFGDGQVLKGGPTMRHSYTKGGKYPVSVAIDNELKNSLPFEIKEAQVWVNSAPVVSMGPNLVCCPDTEAVFDASASCDPDGDGLSYLWDFGDGATAQGVSVTHSYAKPGEFKVTLTVKDNSGFSCNTAQDSFVAAVKNKPVSVINIEKQ